MATEWWTEPLEVQIAGAEIMDELEPGWAVWRPGHEEAGR